MADPSARSRAAESVAARFTRVMSATTSRWGTVTDPPVLALATGVFLIVLLASLRIEGAAGLVPVFAALTALPLVVGVVVWVALLGARARVIDWLAGLPFPVENFNTVLNGLGESLEITFAASSPPSPDLNAQLDAVSPDAFVTKAPDVLSGSATATGPSIVEVRIGVVDSTRNPSASNFRRYERVRALIDTVLVPLHAKHPVVEVRIK
jgi:xanthine/uracil/vitamin C permease (AzgA family)